MTQLIGNINPLIATQPWNQVSENYRFLSTEKVLDLASNAGFEVHQTKVARVKRMDKIGYQKHRVDLVHKSFKNDAESIPRLTLINSHDRTAALTLSLGFFRLVCENGLMMGDFLGSTAFKTLHSGKRDLEQDVTYRIAAALEAFPKLIETRDAMRGHQVHAVELQHLTGSVQDYIQKTTGLLVVAGDLDLANRRADLGTDLWSVTNRIQESVIRGGYRATNLETGKTRRASKIVAIDKDVKINKFIMDRAMEVLTGRAA